MRKVIFTSVTGSYDVIAAPKATTPGWEWVAFVDDDYAHEVPAPWRRERMPELPGLAPAMRQRYVKMMGPELLGLPDGALVIGMDANMTVKGDLDALVRESGHRKGGLTATRHWKRKCAWRELTHLRKHMRITQQQHMGYVKVLRNERITHNRGLWECGLLIRHNTPEVRCMMRRWWQAIQLAGCHRDQPAFPLVVAALGDRFTAMERTTRNTYIELRPHGSGPVRWLMVALSGRFPLWKECLAENARLADRLVVRMDMVGMDALTAMEVAADLPTHAEVFYSHRQQNKWNWRQELLDEVQRLGAKKGDVILQPDEDEVMPELPYDKVKGMWMFGYAMVHDGHGEVFLYPGLSHCKAFVYVPGLSFQPYQHRARLTVPKHMRDQYVTHRAMADIRHYCFYRKDWMEQKKASILLRYPDYFEKNPID